MMNAWYSALERPPLTPPDWIFGPVWTVLYLMIAVSIVLFLRQSFRERPVTAWILIVVHLASNALWTPLFFGMQRPGWALVDILFLDATLVALILRFWKSSRIASALLWPYLAWVSFASYLNAGFFLLN